MDELRLQDEGVKIRVTLKDPAGTAVDVSTATLIKFHFQKPDVSLLSVTGSFNSDGNDGKVYYTTVSGDLSQTGVWKYQVYITLSTGVLHSAVGKFKVTDILKH